MLSLWLVRVCATTQCEEQRARFLFNTSSHCVLGGWGYKPGTVRHGHAKTAAFVTPRHPCHTPCTMLPPTAGNLRVSQWFLLKVQVLPLGIATGTPDCAASATQSASQACCSCSSTRIRCQLELSTTSPPRGMHRLYGSSGQHVRHASNIKALVHSSCNTSLSPKVPPFTRGPMPIIDGSTAHSLYALKRLEL